MHRGGAGVDIPRRPSEFVMINQGIGEKVKEGKWKRTEWIRQLLVF
jgi:hypothetical protein